MRYKFYNIKTEYCDYLRQIDHRVPFNMDKKENRPFIGIVFSVNGHDYFAPLSSPKPKHLTMKNQVDFLKINSGQWGAINFNNMIPIEKDESKQIDIKIQQTDSKDVIDYKNLLTNQLSWCNQIENSIRIQQKAEKLYSLIVNDHANISLKKRCCDFAILEQKCKDYKQEKNKDLSIADKLKISDDKIKKDNLYKNKEHNKNIKL